MIGQNNNWETIVMFLLEYAPFVYVGVIALFTILIAYYASDIFIKSGGSIPMHRATVITLFLSMAKNSCRAN